MSTRLMGTVKFFLSDKGYGFIIPDEGGADVYVHASHIPVKNSPLLEEGERVTYELIPGRKSENQAGNVSLFFDLEEAPYDEDVDYDLEVDNETIPEDFDLYAGWSSHF